MKRLFIHYSIYLLYCHRLVIGLMVLVPLLLASGGELRPQPLFAQSGPTKLTAPVAPVGSAQRLQPGQVPSGLTATSWASIQSQIQQSFHVNNASPEQVTALSQQAYAKASNTEAGDQFGWRVAVSGNTVVIGALTEDSNATGVNGNQADNSLQNSGAVYVFVRNGTSWSQQAYLKASNPDANDNFGQSVAISGETIVVGAQAEASSATGVGGSQSNNAAAAAGAVYVFVRNGASWSQQAYLKASNTEAGDQFGEAVAIAGDTIVVGARSEDSNAMGFGGNQGNNSATDAGAAYVFVRSGTSWSQQAYFKASNTEAGDQFGNVVAVAGDTVVIGALTEDSSAAGPGGNQGDNAATNAGAAYVFVRNGASWSQQAYLKASNPGANDNFGQSVAISADTVVVGAQAEASSATGVGGTESDNSAAAAGAAYVFIRNGASWSQQAYLKASNTEAGDQFGWSVAISGETIVVGALTEDSNATGIGGSQVTNSASNSGAAYLFVRSGTSWSQQEYIKASNTGADDEFGVAVGVANETVVVGTRKEDSNATDVDGANNDGAADAGAAYFFHMPNNFGVTVTNVMVNGSSQSATVKPNEIFTVTLDYNVYDANCPACIKQIVFGYSNESKPQVCVYSGVPGAAGVTGSATFTMTAPATPGLYTIGSDNPAQFSCNDALGGWWSGPPDASRTVVTVEAKTYVGVTFYVNDDAPGANNGSSWNDAYVYLQDALAAAQSGDEIWVAEGVYYPDKGGSATDNDRTATFQLKNGVRLYGGFSGSETASNQRNFFTNTTILSGDIDQNDSNSDGNNVAETWNDLQGSNAYHVVTGSNTDGAATLNGFTITAGQTVADAPSNSCSEHLCGGGLFVNNGSPSLAFLFLSGNQAKHGGGMALGSNSSPTLLNVIFRGNRATAFGGGIDLGFNSNPTLTNTTFSGNRADAGGGGMSIVNSNPLLTNVTFVDNQAGVEAAGMRSALSNPVATNVTFSGNLAPRAGAIVQQSGGLTLKNSTLFGNQAGADGAILSQNGVITITNSILANSVGGANCSGTIVSGDYNLSSDASCSLDKPHDRASTAPQLAALADNGGATQTHALQTGSPAIDKGNCSGNTVMVDQRGVTRPQGPACDIGAYEVTGASAYDFGDAPDPTYPTLLASNGARHGLVSNRHLGATVDSEADGQPTANADGDDSNGDDDDGVVLPAALNICTLANLNVTAAAAGLLNGWIDFNADGDWGDAGEQILRGLALNAGAQTLSFQVPCDAAIDKQVAARFRFGGTAILGPSGAAFDGEVEDYLVALQRGNPLAQPDQAETNEDRPVLIDVLANDLDPVGGPLTLVAVTAPARGSAVIESGRVRYTPHVDFAGVDTFAYTLQNEVGKQVKAQVNIRVRAANDAPTNLALSNNSLTIQGADGAFSPGYAELRPGTVIGFLSTSDPDPGDTHTYKTAPSSQGPFAVVNDVLQTLQPIRIASSSFVQYTVVIISSDQAGAAIERSFTVTIFGPRAPDGPVGMTLSKDQIGENQPANAVVGILSTADAKSSVHTYSLVAGTGSDNNNSFVINGNQLLAKAPLDYEAKELHSIRVRTVNDKGAGMEQPFVIKVIDDNSEPGEPTPQYCSTATIKLLDTADALVEVTNVAAASQTANGCTIQGMLHVRIPGSEVAGIAFTGRVDAKNQLYSDTRLQALNQQVASSEAQTSAGIGAFKLNVAGLTLEVNKATVEYYLGRPGLRLAGAKWCLPAAWGGLCSPLSSSDILIDASGLRLGGSAGFSLPEIILGKAASRLPGPRLIGLKATLNPVAGGYEITAAGQFGIPKLPMKIGGAGDCGLTASLTIYVDAATGATVLSLDASAAGLQSDGAIAGVALRQVSIGMECDKGIPLGMGLQLTGIRGTLSLRAGDQYISLGVTIETIAKAGPFTLAKLDGDATVLWDPEWGFDLVATLKLLGFLEAARSEMNIRENRFHFDGYIRGGITSGHVRLDAWTRNGSFYMTGSGKYALGIAKGAVYSSHSRLVMAAETGETAGTLFGWDDVRDVGKKVVDTVANVGSAVIDQGREVVVVVVDAVQRVMSIDLPPIDLTVGSVNGDLGRFTNDNWGIKGYIKLGDVVGDTAQAVLEFFHVPAEFGVFVDHTGNLDFGGVSEYTLVTPPPILAARQRWQMAQAAQVVPSANVSAATDGQFSFVSENEVIIATPLTLEQPVVRAATVISQVRISAPATVNFMLASYEPLTMTLLAPDGTHITPANYNQPPINQKYQIDYGVRTIYEAVERTAIPNTDARLRFIPASNLPQFAAVDVLVDGVPVWQNVKPFNPAARDPDYDSNYLAIEPGLHTLSLVPTGQSTVIVSTTLDAQLGVGYTIATAGAGTPQVRLLSDEQATPPSFGQAYARFVHLGDADRKVTVLINGVPAFSNLNYRDASAYQLLPAGDVTIEVVDATTNAVIAPQRILPLRDTSLVFTFFLFDYNADAFTLDYIGAIDDLYLPHLYAIYAVGGADMGDWKVDLAGDLAGVNYALSVNAFAAPTQLSNVTVNAGNLSQTQVNWTLKSEFAPTLVTLYANPGELTGPLSYTNTNGISVTEQITNFMGFPVKQVTLSDPNQLNNAVGGLIANLTELESGTYRLWLQVDDGVNPPRALYARDPGTGQIAVITVNNTNFPQSWTPTITPTIDVDNALLGVQWTGLTHPDIDSYTLHLGTTPGASERTDSGLAPIYAQDAAGQTVGLPLVSGLFSNIEPGRTYYLYIEAIDAESGRLVRSPIFSVTISQGAFALTASSTHYLVARGSTIKAPLALEVTTPLFDPNVALAIYDEGLPRGIWAQFEHDLVGETSLQDDSSGLAVSAAGANPVIVHKASVLAAVQTATLVITVTETVTDGLYPLTVIGYNGVDGEQRLTIYLQVGAVGFQAQTMCYGPDLDLRIPFSAAAVQAGIDLVVITGPLPPNLMLNGAATCIPYTSLRSMVELTNQLVTQGCANNTACNPVERIVFDYDGSYRIETIQTVEVVRDLFLPLVSNACIGSLACN